MSKHYEPATLVDLGTPWELVLGGPDGQDDSGVGGSREQVGVDEQDE